MLTDKYTDCSDDALMLLLCQHDDELAFREVYHRYGRTLVYTAIRKTGQAEVAEDLVQELFVKLWLSRKKLVIQKTLIGYLQGMLRNGIITHYHKEKSKNPVSLDEAYALGDYQTTEQIQYDQLHDLYQESLQKIPEKCRAVFVLSRKGYSIKEIAQIQQISEKTVEAHISKALRILRVEMKDYMAVALLFLLS